MLYIKAFFLELADIKIQNKNKKHYLVLNNNDQLVDGGHRYLYFSICSFN